MENYYGHSQIEDLKNSIDIVNIVETYVPLKQRGSYFTACCPFHDEKTPSFVIYPDTQTFHCYGGSCDMGGDVIHFVQEIDKLSFNEAVETLALKAGIHLVPEKSSVSPAQRTGKMEMFKANHFTMEYFAKSLFTPSGKNALEYLKKRGISDKMIQRFSIGFSKPGLINEIKKNNLDIKPFEKTGLTGKSSYSNSYFEKFKNRIMFPIKDVRGRVTGFGGRILETAGESKYINSPASPVFNKKENLYGLDLLKEIHSKTFPAVIVEGYTDVIGLYQAGFPGAVATLGTALSAEHIRILKRFTDTFVIFFDADEPGRNAAGKSIDLFIAADVDVSFITLPDQKDPFEFVTLKGIDAFNKKLSKARSMYDFKRGILINRYGNTSDVSTVNKIVTGLVSTFSTINAPVKRELLLKKISSDYDISLESLEKLAVLDKKHLKKTVPPDQSITGTLDTAERNLIKTIVLYPDLFPATHDQISPGIFQNKTCKYIYEKCIQQYEEDSVLIPEKLLSYIQDSKIASTISTCIHREEDIDLTKAKTINKEDILFILKKDIDRQIKEINKKRKDAEKKGDEKNARMYFAQLDIMQKQKHSLAR